MKPTPNKLIDLMDKSEVCHSSSATGKVGMVAVMRKNPMITAESTGKNDSKEVVSTTTMDRRTSPETNGMSNVSAARLSKGSDDGLWGVCWIDVFKKDITQR